MAVRNAAGSAAPAARAGSYASVLCLWVTLTPLRYASVLCLWVTLTPLRYASVMRSA